MWNMSKTENITNITTDDKGTVRGLVNGDENQKVVQLVCAHEGHTFWRKSQRGRRPEFCPEHTPVEETKATNEIVTVDEDGQEIVEIPSPWEGLSDDDKAFIESIKDQFERNKFYYYDRELHKNLTPRVEESDEDMQYVAPSHLNTRARYTYLKSSLSELLTRSKQRAGHRTIVVPEIEEEIVAA